jgi:hypothetical protein
MLIRKKYDSNIQYKSQAVAADDRAVYADATLGED